MKAVTPRADAAWWIMQQRQWSKWSTIASSVREAHPRCAARNCFSGVIFGLPFLGQTWKKALWGLARRSEPLSARLTRNTSLASRRLTRRTVLHEASAILHGATAAAAQHRPQPFQAVKLRSPAVVQPLGGGRFLSRPLPNWDANQGQTEQRKEQW